MTNDVIFGGKDVVRVTNMAVVGATTYVGALALEYSLHPPKHPGPDLIIHVFEANDIRFIGDNKDGLRIIQDFIRAAKHVRCGGLPAVVF